MFKTVLSGEQRGQEMGPNLILTSWVVGLERDLKWMEEGNNKVSEKGKSSFLYKGQIVLQVLRDKRSLWRQKK